MFYVSIRSLSVVCLSQDLLGPLPPPTCSLLVEKQRVKRRRILRELIQTDVLVLQETHGCLQDINEFGAMSPSHSYFSSLTGAIVEV